MLIINDPLGQSTASTTRRPRKVAQIKRAGRWSSHPHAPAATTWRLGPEFPAQVAYVCPRCGGLHHDDVSSFTGTDTARVSKCPPEFARSGWINIDVVKGRPPLNIERAFYKRFPLWDLVFAYAAVEADLGDIRVRPTCKRAFEHPAVWIPGRGTLPRALEALSKVGFRAEAKELRRDLGGYLHAHEGRLLASDEWCLRLGPFVRGKLLATLRAAWQAGGRS